MSLPSSKSVFHSFLYGGASILLIFNIFFFIEAILWSNFVPIIPILAGTFSALGLLIVVLAEDVARRRDRLEHRRLSRVAHQLESPLQSLQRDVEQLQQQGSSLPAELRLTLKHMQTRTSTVLENVRDIFLLLQAQEGPIVKDPRLYNVCTIVQEVIGEEQGFASAKNVEIIHQLHCDDAPVRLDRTLFVIALTHLLKNALTYTITPGLVNVAVRTDTKSVHITIQDRGVGLHRKDQRAIWHPFVRGENADRFDPNGIGIGLTLSNYIITQLGGSLRARARTDTTGMEFEITLPLAKK